MTTAGKDKKVAEFTQALDELRRAIDQGTTLHIATVVTRMAGEVNLLCRWLESESHMSC